MFRRFLKLASFLLVFPLILCGCLDQAQPATATATLPPTDTARPTAPATETVTPSPAPTITPVNTSAPTKTKPPTRPATPTATPTPPTDRLVGRQPSFREINHFFYVKDSYLRLAEESEFERVDLDQDGSLDFFHRHKKSEGELSIDEWEVAVILTDVNGDGEADLIVYGTYGLAVWLWDQDGYAATLLKGPYGGRAFQPVITASFVDLTADGGKEILFDVKTAGGGTGLWTWDTTRYVFHCRGMNCQKAWEGVLRYETSDYNAGGFALTQSEFFPLPDKTAFEVRSSGFWVNCCFDGLEFWNKGWGEKASTLSTYAWNGETFQLTSKTTLSPGASVDSKGNLMAKNHTGGWAAIIYEANRSLGNANEVCTLLVNREVVGDPFGCNHRFTSVSWQDITGDGAEDLVIVAFSAGWPLDRDGNQLDEIQCMHQRLLAYRWKGGAANQIANETGCVEDETLFGVRLEDVDQDGRLEIVAAANDSQPRRTLRWNGARFVVGE